MRAQRRDRARDRPRQLEAVHLRHAAGRARPSSNGLPRRAAARRSAIAAAAPSATSSRSSPTSRAGARGSCGSSRCRRRRGRAARPASSAAAARRRRRPALAARGSVEPERAAARRARCPAPISPPMSSTSCLEIARPRPVPPYLRVVEPSACAKGSKSCVERSGAMPMPVSVTSNAHQRRRVARAGRRDAATHDLALVGELDRVADQVDQHLAQPRGVAAHQRRDLGTDRRRQLEALRVRRSASRSQTPSTSLAQVEVDALELELAGLDLREVEDVVDDRQQRLARAADRLGVLALLRRRARVSSRSSVMPITPFIGVRISWLMLARNSTSSATPRAPRRGPARAPARRPCGR